MVNGVVINNTGRSRHIFKQTIFPGQEVPLQQVYDVLGNKTPEGLSFVDWLRSYLPDGWEVHVEEKAEASVTGGRLFKEVLTAVPVVENAVEAQVDVVVAPEEDELPSWQYATPRAIEQMTAKDIYNLRMKDNPQRVLKQINSIYKLRRALTMCKRDSRKAILTRLLQGRIKSLNQIL